MPLTLAQMLALFNDNTSGDISAADGRSVITGLYETDRGTPPVNGDFSWVNQNSAALNVNTRGHISVIAPNNTTGSLSCRVKTAPSTPYTVTVRLAVLLTAADFMGAGLLFRQSSDGKLSAYSTSYNASQGGFRTAVDHWNSATSYNSAQNNTPHGGLVRWFRIADNGTNRLYSVSQDGENFIQIFSEGRTTFLTADQVGFFVNAQHSGGISGQIVIESWDEA